MAALSFHFNSPILEISAQLRSSGPRWTMRPAAPRRMVLGGSPSRMVTAEKELKTPV